MVGPISTRTPAAPPRIDDAAAITPPVSDSAAGLGEGPGRKTAAPGSKDVVKEAQQKAESSSAGKAGAAGSAPAPKDSSSMRPKGKGAAKGASAAKIDPKLAAQFKKIDKMKPEEVVALAKTVGAAGSTETTQKFQDALRELPVEKQNPLLQEMYKTGDPKVGKALDSYFMTSGTDSAAFLKSITSQMHGEGISDKDLAKILTGMPANDLQSAMFYLASEKPETVQGVYKRLGTVVNSPDLNQETKDAVKDKIFSGFKRDETMDKAVGDIFKKIAAEPPSKKSTDPPNPAHQLLASFFDEGGASRVKEYKDLITPEVKTAIKGGITEPAVSAELEGKKVRTEATSGGGKEEVKSANSMADLLLKGTVSPTMYVETLGKLSGDQLKAHFDSMGWEKIRDIVDMVASKDVGSMGGATGADNLKKMFDHIASNAGPDLKARLADVLASAVNSGKLSYDVEKKLAADQIETLIKSDPNGVMEKMNHEYRTRALQTILQTKGSLSDLQSALPELSPENAGLFARALTSAAGNAGAAAATGTFVQALLSGVELSAEIETKAGTYGLGFSPEKIMEWQKAVASNGISASVDGFKGLWTDVLKDKSQEYRDRFAAAAEPLLK